MREQKCSWDLPIRARSKEGSGIGGSDLHHTVPAAGCGVWGLGAKGRVQGLGFGIQDWGLRIGGRGFMVWGLGRGSGIWSMDAAVGTAPANASCVPSRQQSSQQDVPRAISWASL